MSRMSLRAPILVVGLLVSAAMLTSCGPAPAPADSAGDTAAVKQMLVDSYFLESEMVDDRQIRQRKWLESASAA